MNARRKAPNKRNDSSDFVEALARGLDVIKAFGPTAMELTVSEVAARTGLARPTARRLLMTLEQLGYTRLSNGAYSLTTKTLELGTSYVAAQGLWDIARPHLVVARVADRRVELDVATRRQRHRVHGTGAGAQDHRHLRADRDAIPGGGDVDGSRAARRPRRRRNSTTCWPRRRRRASSPASCSPGPSSTKSLAEIRERGWALSDELLSLGIRSIAAPVRDRSGRTAAAMNVTVHAAETSIDAPRRRVSPAAPADRRRRHVGVVRLGDAASLTAFPGHAGRALTARSLALARSHVGAIC